MDCHHYVKVAPRTSANFSSSLVLQQRPQKKISNFPKQQASRHSTPYQVQSSKKSFTHTNHNRNAKKMSISTLSASSSTSIKRPHEDDDQTRPFKKIIVEVTGLEQDSILDDLTSRTPSIITASEVDLYRRRRRVAKSVGVEKKMAMVSQVSRDLSDMPAIAQKGMDNWTNYLCYRLSLLQALLHQVLFVQLILNFHPPEICVSDLDACVTCSLRLLILEYWKGPKELNGTLKALQRMDRLFTSLGWGSDVSSGQADPEEHLGWIWGKMKAELPSSVFGCLQAFLQPVTSSVVSCECGHEAKRNGQEDLFFPVPLLEDRKGHFQPSIPGGTLSKYLNQYMMENLEDYRCDGCGDATRPKTRNQILNYTPEIVSIQLKFLDKWGYKVKPDVKIEAVLDLSSYRDTSTTDQLQYGLVAVIKHIGNSGAGGHYVAFTKGSDGNWMCFDDKKKRVSSFDAAIKSTGGRLPETPYLLFFQRQ